MALLPRRGRIIQWFTLIVALVTFGLTLHLPVHYLYGHPGFQFEVDRPWISSPAIRYHLGVDGISLWLVVLTGFLAPLGVLASWKTITHRTKEFYFFFLLQQTAMIGVFVALDMFLYYAFWELTLVPMAILISMFGRDRGTEAAIKFFIYTFLSSALLLVAIVWLYARTGSFDFVRVQSITRPGWFAASGALLGRVSISSRLCGQGSGLSPAWLAGGRVQRSTHCDGHGDCRQAGSLFHPALQSRSLPCPGPPGGAVDDRAGGDRDSLWLAGGAGAEGYEATGGVLDRRPSQLLHSGHLLLRRFWSGRRGLPDPQRRHLRGCAFPIARLHVRTLWNV